MTLLKTLISTVIAGVLFSSLVQADAHHGESATFTRTAVNDNITMLQGKGGNVAVMTGAQGTLMIDDDYREMSEALKTTLQSFGGTEKLAYIINTHWHGDHTQGNLALGHDAQIIAHDNVRARLLTAQEIKLFNMVSEPYPEHALPSLTYEKKLSLHINGEQVDVVHYPAGHTDGDSIVFFRNANVVHMGDHFFNGFFPFVDVDSGGNVRQMAANIAKVLAEIDDQTVLIPGHGPLGTKAELVAFRQMLIGTSAEVAAMVAQGMTLEQIKAKGLSTGWNDWTDGFLSTGMWITIVHNSLVQ